MWILIGLYVLAATFGIGAVVVGGSRNTIRSRYQAMRDEAEAARALGSRRRD